MNQEESLPLDLTVVILTRNESVHIARALQNMRGLAKRVVVVDSYSTDDTVALATQHGAEVLQHKFVNYARQFQWALDNAQINTQWVMRLDADELVEPDLRAEMLKKLPSLPTSAVGINLKRKHIFMYRWVRHGGRYPLVLLRIWRHGHGRIEDRWMDEHMIVWGGSVVTFDGGFADHNLNDLSFFTTKHNGYATREAIDILIQRRNLAKRDKALNARSASLQASVKRFVKERIYNRIPFTVSALLYFLWRYIFQLGFLDGRTGFIYHFLQAYWYRFLVGAKLLELENGIRSAESKEAIVQRIFVLTGHNLDTK